MRNAEMKKKKRKQNDRPKSKIPVMILNINGLNTPIKIKYTVSIQQKQTYDTAISV